MEQQVPLHRVKKTYSPPTDPLWDEQWYLVSSQSYHDRPMQLRSPLVMLLTTHHIWLSALRTYMDHWPMGLGSYLCNQPYIFNEWSLESKLHFMIMHDGPYINCFIVTLPIYNYKSEWFLVHVQHLGMISNVMLSLSSYLCGICQLIMIRYQCAHRTV